MTELKNSKGFHIRLDKGKKINEFKDRAMEFI